jgi:hypothetical protein
MKISELRKTSITCALFGLGMLIFFGLSGDIPERKMLTKIEGNIDWVKATGKNGSTLRFKFLNDDTHLIYHSIGGKVSKTHSALLSRNASITVLYDQSDSHSPPFDENSYYTIYELIKNGSVIRSRENLIRAYAANSRLLAWMGLGSLVITGLFLIADLKQRKSS